MTTLTEAPQKEAPPRHVTVENITSEDVSLEAATLELDERKLELIRRVPVFARWLDQGVQCLKYLARGEEVRLKPGEILVHEGDPAAFFLLIEGELRVMKKVGDSEMLLTTHRPGVFFGEIPLLLGTSFVASGQAVGEALVFRLKEPDFWGMMSACPGVTREIATTMATRTQNLESVAQTREKLVALGTLAAGLAHELNNPASAAKRASSVLRETQREVEMRAITLHGLGLLSEQCDMLARGREEAVSHAHEPLHELTAMQRSDAEDELADWLDAHDITDGYKLAPTFVAAGVDIAWLESLAKTTPCHALDCILLWLEASLRADALIVEIEKSSEQISHLVCAVKSYSHLDRAPQQMTDVHEGLDSTLTMLKYKLRGIELKREYDRSLPRLMAHGSELNQVWTNLLDNAADVLKDEAEDKPKAGARIVLRTKRDGGYAVVEIADNGPGIPEEVRSHIFEPFFTTKGVGAGTGLGLDIAHRIVVGRHGGDVSIQSDETGTTFTIRLPLENVEASEAPIAPDAHAMNGSNMNGSNGTYPHGAYSNGAHSNGAYGNGKATNA